VTVVNEPFSLTLTFTYDGVGNRTQVQDSKGGVTTSVYDNANNLSSRQFTDGTTSVSINFTNDGNNQLSTVTRYKDLTGTTKIGCSRFSTGGCYAVFRFGRFPNHPLPLSHAPFRHFETRSSTVSPLLFVYRSLSRNLP
jgi:YD repeat-containing protein